MHVTAQLLAICISAATMSILVPHLPSRTEWVAVAYHHEGNRIDLHDRLSSERSTVVITGEPACIYTAIHSRHSNNDIDSTGTDIGTIMGNSDALNDANVMSVREEDFLKAARNVTNSTDIGNHSLDPNPDNVSNNKENDLAIHALIIQEGDVRVDSDQNSNITTEEYGYECHSNGNNDNVTYASLETHPSSITLQPDKTCTLPQLMLTGIRHHYDMLYIALASYSLQPNHSMDIHSNMGSTHHDDVSNMQLLLCGESTNDDDEIGATRRYKEWKVVNTDSDSTIATGMNMPNHSGSRANDKQSSWMLDHDNGHQHLTMAFERMDCSYCSRYSRLLFDWMTSEITTNRRGVTSTGKCEYYLVRICVVSSGYPFGGRSFSGNKWNLQLHELID